MKRPLNKPNKCPQPGVARRGRPPGSPKIGGRTKGTPNYDTRNVRLAIAKFLDERSGQIDSWFDELLQQSKVEAFKVYMGLLEYHIPKLQRTELTGMEGKELAPTKIILVAGGGQPPCPQPLPEKRVSSSRQN